jgi:hypothetical protein
MYLQYAATHMNWLLTQYSGCSNCDGWCSRNRPVVELIDNPDGNAGLTVMLALEFPSLSVALFAVITLPLHNKPGKLTLNPTGT